MSGRTLNYLKTLPTIPISKGHPVPEGERGLLINQTFADARLKLWCPLVDKIAESAKEDVTMMDSADLAAKARRLRTQGKSVARLIAPTELLSISKALKKRCPHAQSHFRHNLTVFSFAGRHHRPKYRAFYDIVAPKIELYPFKVGEAMTLKTWTKSGFAKAVNAKVWGTFYFKGLETSLLAANLLDLDTFRELMSEYCRTTSRTCRNESE